MPSCFVIGCPNSGRKFSKVFYLTLSRSNNSHAEWLNKNIKGPLKPGDSVSVCEKHLYKTQFAPTVVSERIPTAKFVDTINMDDDGDKEEQLTLNKNSESEQQNNMLEFEVENINTDNPGPSNSEAKTVTRKVTKRSNIKLVEKEQNSTITNRSSGTAKIRKKTVEINQKLIKDSDELESRSYNSERTDFVFKIEDIKDEIQTCSDDDDETVKEDVTPKEEPVEYNDNEEVFVPVIDTALADPLLIGLEDLKQETSEIDIGETIVQDKTDLPKIPPDVLDGIFDQYIIKYLISPEDVKFLHTLPFDKDCVLNSNYTNLKNIKEFAMYLYLCSEEIYKSVARDFIPCLPSEEGILQEWITTEGLEGFSNEALNTIIQKVKKSSSEIFCCLIIDDIPLEHNIAFIITVVAINASWKVPLCYFLTASSLEAIKRSKLLKFAVNLVEKSGLIPISVTYQPNYQNMVMAEIFTPNKNIGYEKMICSKKGMRIYLLPDPVFVLEHYKWSIFKDDSDKVISLKHIELLVKHLNTLQAGKLSNRLLGKSMANSLTVCEQEFLSSGYADVSGTIEFLTRLNDFMDILTSHKDGKGWKAAPNRTNMGMINNKLQDLLKYFLGLSVPQKIEEFSSDLNSELDFNMRTMLLNLRTAARTAMDLVLINVFAGNSMSHLDMRKLTMASTIFITLKFSVVTDNGLLKKLKDELFKKQYADNLKHLSSFDNNTTNKLPIENASLLPVYLSPLQKINYTTYQKNSNFILKTAEFKEEIQDDLYKILKYERSEFHDQSFIYIAGYVVYNLVRTMRCDVCINALLHTNPFRQETNDNYVTELVIRKAINEKSSKLCMKLMEPSFDVIKICKYAEILFQKAVNECDEDVFNLKKILLSKFRKNMIGKGFFKGLDFHRRDGDTLYNHVVDLPQAVAEIYFKIRLKYK